MLYTEFNERLDVLDKLITSKTGTNNFSISFADMVDHFKDHNVQIHNNDKVIIVHPDDPKRCTVLTRKLSGDIIEFEDITECGFYYLNMGPYIVKVIDRLKMDLLTEIQKEVIELFEIAIKRPRDIIKLTEILSKLDNIYFSI